MISVEECQDFVPNGRQIAALHPKGLFGDPASDELGEEEANGEWWQLREGGEELYCSSSTVTWSQGGRVKKCYSLREPVLQTLHCTFYSNSPHVSAVQTTEPQVIAKGWMVSNIGYTQHPG